MIRKKGIQFLPLLTGLQSKCNKARMQSHPSISEISQIAKWIRQIEIELRLLKVATYQSVRMYYLIRVGHGRSRAGDTLPEAFVSHFL